MRDVLTALAGEWDWLRYASIPLVAALIGWVTNWVAIRLTFRPLEYVGIRPIGWQGIIPSKAAKMARIFVDTTMFRLGTVRELFLSMEPERIAEHAARMMEPRLERYTDQVMDASEPTMWRLLPLAVKRQVYADVRRSMPRIVRGLVRDTAERIEELIDFRHMLTTRLEGDRALLNRLFLEAGAVEFRFIVRSGLWFGFLFGLVQLAVWLVLPAWWVLPLFGIVVGYATNWFAINIIFRPLRPRRIGPWTLQGLFLKRQREVAAIWCRLVTTEIVTLQHIMYAIMYGPNAARAEALIRRHVQVVVDEVIERYRPAVDVAVGAESRATIRRAVGDTAVRVSTDPFDHWPFNRDTATRAEALLRERMEQLSPSEFQDLLRPCFQEDELKLILTGAVLGFVAGVAQLVFVFGGRIGG